MKKLAPALMTWLLLGLLLLPACAARAPAPQATPAPPASSEWQRVEEAAKREGRVTVYFGAGSPPLMEAIIAEFPKQMGLNVELIALGGAEIREKVRMEQQARVNTADVVASAISTPGDVAAMGFAERVVELPAEKDKAVFRTEPWQFDRERRMVMVWAEQVNPSILVNTQMVREGEIKAWKDLLDPKWKGKIVILDPRYSGGATMQAYSASELGMEFWKKLAQQNLKFDRNGSRVIQTVALGEKPIAVFAQTAYSEGAILAGAPVKFLHLEEGSASIPYGAALVKNAPHPNAALVFMNWLISKEGHEIAMKAAHWAGLRKDLEPTWLKIPEFRPGTEKRVFSKVLHRPEHAQEAIAFMRQALGEP